jgi:hypothetical protein
MPDTLHKWETIESKAGGGYATVVTRLSVPNGWIYSVSLVRSYWFRQSEIHTSTVFVPDVPTPNGSA